MLVQTEPIVKMEPRTIGRKIIINFNGVHDEATRDAMNKEFRDKHIPLAAIFKIKMPLTIVLVPPEGKFIELEKGEMTLNFLYYDL